MDPKLVKGLIVVVALAMQAYAGIPMDLNTVLTGLAMLGLGTAVVKRPGDSAPRPAPTLPFRV